MEFTNQQNLERLFENLAQDPSSHSCLSSHYSYLKTEVRTVITKLYGENTSQSANFPNIGSILLPYFSMGKVDSTNLFDLDELIIFAFYSLSRERYKRVLDIGANLGLHSIIMAKLGFSVTSFEPDPVHHERLLLNLELNDVSNIADVIKAAVSDSSGRAEFTRVLGNTTGSHLSTSKIGAYGELQKFDVDVVSINEYLINVDLIKLDAEGEELNILKAINSYSWDHLDVIAEVGNERNGKQIFSYLEDIDVKVYAQKLGWNPVNDSSMMPKSYREGSVFISRNNTTPWGVK